MLSMCVQSAVENISNQEKIRGQKGDPNINICEFHLSYCRRRDSGSLIPETSANVYLDAGCKCHLGTTEYSTADYSMRRRQGPTTSPGIILTVCKRLAIPTSI